MTKLKYALACLPFLLPCVGWKLVPVIGAAWGCPVADKWPQPCIVAAVNVELALSAIAWWGMLLWAPGLLISGLWLGSYIAPHLPRPWGRGPRRGSGDDLTIPCGGHAQALPVRR